LIVKNYSTLNKMFNVRNVKISFRWQLSFMRKWVINTLNFVINALKEKHLENAVIVHKKNQYQTKLMKT
jgi:hypothetical protein